MSRALAVLLKLSSDPMIFLSGEGIIVSANQAFAELCETTVDRLRGQSIMIFFGTPEARVREIVERCSRTSGPLPFSAEVRTAKGVPVRCHVLGALLERGESSRSTTISLRVTPHPASTQNFKQLNEEISSLKREILARKQMEEALRRSEEELSEFFENASVGLHWVGPDGTILRVNRAELQLLGYSREECVGRPITDFHVDQPVIDDILARLGQGDVLTEYPARLRCKDGSIRHVLISSSGLFRDGALVHTRCFTNDVTDRQAAEQALRASEARYRDLIHGLPAAVYTCDCEGRITLFNHAAAVLWGREPAIGNDQWCGSWKIYRPDGTPLPLDQCPMSVTLREGRAVRGEEIIIERPDGTRRHILPHPEPLKDEQGRVVGAINMLVDITERKEAERALANLAAIVTSSDDAIVGKNLDGIVTSWNKAAERLFGYRADEMIGQSVLRLIPPERHDEEPGILARLRRGQAIEHYETIRCRKDGSRLHVSLSVSPVIDSHGTIIGASKIARDITEQKVAEQALVQSREKLQSALAYQESIISNMGEGLYTVDCEGLVTAVNEAAERLFGWTREELLGRKMHDVTHYVRPDGTPFPAEECAGLRVLHEGVAVVNREDQFIRKDGTLFDVVYSSSPLWANGRIAGLVVVFRDVSDKKKADEALRERDRALTMANEDLSRQTAALTEANKELEQFSYSISHDLRAPLRTIDAFTRIVLEEHGAQLDVEAARCLTIVRKAAGQAGELIDDLLEFSKLSRQSMRLESVAIANLAREVAEDLRIMQQSRKIDFMVGDLPHAHGDRRLLKIVWTNLIGNAVKYTQYREETKIEVGWIPDEAGDDRAVYYVKDNGVGFDMRYVGKLFGVFQRLHRKEEFEGTGVGLAIVQRVIHRHGGRVWAEGKVDGGATIYFSLRKAAS